MTPIPTEWWLRPVSKAARVGAHSAVVWKRLYFRPFPASRSAVGVAHGPPNALDAAKPTSSSKTTSTLGAPAGGCSGSIGGNDASGSLASPFHRSVAGAPRKSDGSRSDSPVEALGRPDGVPGRSEGGIGACLKGQASASGRGSDNSQPVDNGGPPGRDSLHGHREDGGPVQYATTRSLLEEALSRLGRVSRGCR
jgi:hypothetical protein